jgi:hypothetical protein
MDVSGRVPPVVELAAELDRHFDDRKRQKCPCGWRDTGDVLHLGHVAESLMPVMLRVLGEHGDTQQVKEELVSSGALVLDRGDRINAVMAVVAPHLIARDELIEQYKTLRQAFQEVSADEEHYATRAKEFLDRAERAEADLAAVRMQVRVRDARLDQVRMIVLDPEFPDVKPDGPVMTKLRRILDAPAGYDAKERT